MTIVFSLPGNYPVYAYSLLIGAAASIGLGRLLLQPGARFTEAVTGGIVLVTALAGARAAYLLLQPGLPFFDSPLGGLSWAGALTGGLTGSLLAAKITKRPALETADRLVLLAAALTAASWLGCWLEGCAYGAESGAWYALPAADEWGNAAGRVPVQAAGVLLAALTYAAAELVHRSARPGRAAGAWLLLSGIQFWWLHSLRTDPAPAWMGVRPDLWASGVVTALGLIVLTAALAARSAPHPNPSDEKAHEM